MWLPWGNHRRSNGNGAGGGARLSRHLSSSSFKDLDSLLLPSPISTSVSRSLPNSNPHPKPTSSHPESPVIHRTFSLRSSRRDSFHLSHHEADQLLSKQVIVYSTSFGAIRKTSDDCRDVLSILRGLRIFFDERDVSMDSRYLAELKMLVGRNKVSLPQVFIDGRRVGGAEEVRKLHESGELRRILEGAPMAGGGTCRACGGVRFVVCGTCEGSHRLYSEKIGKFRTCAMCNENGLVRCGLCVKAV
ncbi:Glutaredoxin-like [Rhynchospora pubera]|uniref:Glutaredoxin-like n=1 Tax=Rhynchospora pubera TaxID=906938 RepID=A0AAV8F5U2_9POAL|nr:Glutaredoxin-like [Rhynchospora pubera]KAJ4786113.1 Glutaredoxin-like [Rhynchospora pubera]